MNAARITLTSGISKCGPLRNDQGPGKCVEPVPTLRPLNRLEYRPAATIGALFWFIGAFALGVSTAQANNESPSVSRCIELVSQQFAIDPLPLHLLAEMEGGWPGAVRLNVNGSEDLGPMQINSIHLPEFAAMGISREDIRDNHGCRNVWVAVVLYVRHLHASHGNPARAIARYHSKTPRHALQYLDRVARLVRKRLQANEPVHGIGSAQNLHEGLVPVREVDRYVGKPVGSTTRSRNSKP